MSSKYNILWIDDEWDKTPSFKDDCDEFYNLLLFPYRSRRDGMEALERNLDFWDAILLDAKMFDESDNEIASISGLGKAVNKIQSLSLKKKIPYFISTGQPDLLDDASFQAMVGHFYIKKKDDEQLCKDIIASIESSESLQIRTKYQEVFDSLERMGISDYSDSILFDILLPLHYTEKQATFKPAYHYNQLRQLIEYLFRACHKIGIIPDQCITKGTVNLNQCSMYLAGKNCDVLGIRYGEFGERIVPEYIEQIIRSILEFGNIHSHTVELNQEDAMRIEGILQSAKSCYLVFGLALQVCELVLWIDNYIHNHNDIDANLSKCKPLIDNYKSKFEGQLFIPQIDEEGNWHCDKCLVKITSWESGQMRLKEVTDNTSRKTNRKYPYFAKFDKVE